MPASGQINRSSSAHGFAHWMLIAALAPPISQWITAILIARIVGVADLGHYVLANAIATPIVLVMQLPLRSVYVVHRNPEEQFDTFMALRLASLCAAMAVAMSLGFLFSTGIAEFAVLALLTVARSAESVSDMLYAPLQREARLSLLARLTVLRTAVGLVTSGLTLFWTGSILLSVAVLALANCVAIVAWEWPTRHPSHVPASPSSAPVSVSACYALARHAAPLSLVQTLTAVGGNTPRYVVQWIGGASALGLYAVLEHFSALTAVACNAKGQTMTAGLAREWHANRKADFRSSAWNLLGSNAFIASGVVLVAVIAGKDIVNLIYGPAFEPAGRWLVLMTLSGLVSAIASSGGYIMTSVGIHREQVPIMAASVAASAAAGCLAALWLGFAGAIVGVMFGAALQILLTAVIMRRALSPEVQIGHA